MIMRLLKGIGLLIGLLVVAVAVFFTLIRTDDMMIGFFPEGPSESIEFSTLVLKESPNQYLVCPENLCNGQQHRVSAIYPTTAEDLAANWYDVVNTKPRMEQKSIDNGNVNQVDYVQRTELMQYPDWITVRFIDLGDRKSTLAIYSRSVYGESDLGVNQERIDAWLNELDVLFQ